MALKPQVLYSAIAVASAMIAGKVVSKERIEARLRICGGCRYSKKRDDSDDSDDLTQALRCGICGCKVTLSERRLLNLARYEETKRYGCKHPKGSRWKKAKV